MNRTSWLGHAGMAVLLCVGRAGFSGSGTHCARYRGRGHEWIARAFELKAVLLAHLFRWRYQPDRCGSSRWIAIETQREDIEAALQIPS